MPSRRATVSAFAISGVRSCHRWSCTSVRERRWKPSCGKASLQLLRDAVDNDVFTCPTCGKSIDLTTTDWRGFLEHAAEFYGRINEAAAKTPK